MPKPTPADLPYCFPLRHRYERAQCCRADQVFDPISKLCVCLEGFEEKNGCCVQIVSPAGRYISFSLISYMLGLGSKLIEWYKFQQKHCRPDQKLNPDTQECECCEGYYEDSGVCKKDPIVSSCDLFRHVLLDRYSGLLVFHVARHSMPDTYRDEFTSLPGCLNSALTLIWSLTSVSAGRVTSLSREA